MNFLLFVLLCICSSLSAHLPAIQAPTHSAYSASSEKEDVFVGLPTKCDCPFKFSFNKKNPSVLQKEEITDSRLKEKVIFPPSQEKAIVYTIETRKPGLFQDTEHKYLHMHLYKPDNTLKSIHNSVSVDIAASPSLLSYLGSIGIGGIAGGIHAIIKSNTGSITENFGFGAFMGCMMAEALLSYQRVSKMPVISLVLSPYYAVEKNTKEMAAIFAKKFASSSTNNNAST